MINSKEKIIEYFKSGIKEDRDFRIGIEHEKFLFNTKDNKRIDYSKVKEMFTALTEFGWNPVFEKENIIGLNKGGKNITLEPGNQIELSGDKLNHMHEACAESQDYLFELKQVTKKLDIKIVSAGFDPISKLEDIPNNPKQRYELMTKDMPLGGELSLDMMYRTCGTQLNIDYNSEEDFNKKFKFPIATHGVDEFIGCEEAMGDLPSLSNSLGFEPIESQATPKTVFQKYVMDSNEIYNHIGTLHKQFVIDTIKLVPEGGNHKDLPPGVGESRKFNEAWTRYHSKKPSKTIDTGHRNHFHYKWNRVPTVRENARLQSFKDSFRFLGTKTSQNTQVGNAVPPLIASMLAKEILNLINEKN